MKKFIRYIPPAIILLVSIGIMTTGGVLKQPFGETDDVIKYINHIESNVKENKWEEAEENMGKLTDAWNKVKKRIQFSVERNELNDFTRNLARLKGAIIGRDTNGIWIELSAIKEDWNHLEN
jgi:uncharacterized protein YfkK (UPF0435 family)